MLLLCLRIDLRCITTVTLQDAAADTLWQLIQTLI